LELQKAQAGRDIENMKFEFKRSLELETSKQGIIIFKALFGDLRKCENIPSDFIGPYIDVTIPLQCAVDSHRLILPGGIGKVDMPGFYNPIPLNEIHLKPCVLYVFYEFKGKRHEVTVAENDALWLPLKNHALADATPKGPDGDLQAAMVKAKQKTPSVQNKHDGNLIMLATTSAALLAMLYFANKKSKLLL
jgi:hypothetical protein